MDEDARIDTALQERDLVRFDIPKDGACFFRAVAQALYTQNEHMQLRNHVMDYVHLHRSEFEPFIDLGSSFEHYVFEMRRPHSWAGQLEISACSRLLSVNFTIYFCRTSGTRSLRDDAEVGQCALQEQRILVEEPGKPVVELIFSHGSHYDLALSRRRLLSMKICQSIVWNIVYSGVLKVAFRNGEERSRACSWRNIACENWRDHQLFQSQDDEKLCDQYMNYHPGDYKNLEGYYRKEDTAEESADGEFITVGRSNRRKRNKREAVFRGRGAAIRFGNPTASVAVKNDGRRICVPVPLPTPVVAVNPLEEPSLLQKIPAATAVLDGRSWRDVAVSSLAIEKSSPPSC